jgi:hypothetical protein
VDQIWVSGAWGLAGAFIWAGPQWLACVFSGEGQPLKCSLEILIRLATGAIAGAAFTPLVLDLLHHGADRSQPIAAMIGLIANTTAPKVVDTLSARIAKAFKSEPPA